MSGTTVSAVDQSSGTPPPLDPGAVFTRMRAERTQAPKPQGTDAAAPSPDSADQSNTTSGPESHLRAAQAAMQKMMEPEPQPHTTPPAQAWGSMAMALAAIGGLLTRTPATVSMNAMAGVLNAYKAGDQARAQQEYERWKTAHDALGKMAELELRSYDAALKESDPRRRLAALQVESAAFANDAIQRHLRMGDLKGAEALIFGMHKSSVSINGAGDAFAGKYAKDKEFLAIAQAQFEAETGRKPGPGDAAKLAQMKLHAEAQFNAESAGGKAAAVEAEKPAKPGTPQAVALQKFIDEHPDATAEDLQKFILGFKPATKAGKAQLLEDDDGTQYLQSQGPDGKPVNMTLTGEPYTPRHAARIGTSEAPRVAERRDADAERKVAADQTRADSTKIRDALAQQKAAAPKPQTVAQMDADAMRSLMASGMTEPEARQAVRGGVTITKDAAHMIAGQMLQGNMDASIRMGRSAANMTLIENAFAEDAKAAGLSPRDITELTLEWRARAAEASREGGAVGGRLGAIAVSGKEATRVAKLVTDAYDKLPRTEFKPFNQLAALIGSQTNSPQQAAAYAADLSLITAYARALNPQGIPRHEDIETAKELLNAKGQSSEAHDAVVRQWLLEIDQIEAATKETRDGLIGAFRTRGGLPPASGVGSQASKFPVADARQAPDGKWYVPDPSRPGKYLEYRP